MSFIEELKRRNVVKVGIAYLVASWLLLQLTEVLTELLELSTDIGKIVIVLLIVGFVPALIFAWAFEMTPEGIKREKDVDRSQSITGQTGRKLDFAVIGMLALIAGYFIWESRFKGAPTPDTVTVAENTPVEAGVAPTKEAAPPELEADAIAVLPFANRSAQDDDLFFTDGIHDDLLTQLAKIDDLKVISRTSVREYRDTTKKLPEIAGELGVSKILEGGVQRAGDRVRINVQLIDVATDQHLWAETFDREMTIDNIFDIQSEITTQIITAVKGELSDVDRATLADRPTDNLGAWEAFLHARAIVAETDYSADKYQRAEPFAFESVRLDPEFTEAWALLATIQMQGVWIGYANTEAQREAIRESIRIAVALDPDNPDVIKAQADYHYRIEVDYASSLARIEEALELAPGNAVLHRDRGLSLRRLGRWEDAVDAFERCLELDPLNSFAASTLAETLSIMNAIDRVLPLTEFWLRRVPDSSDLLTSRAVAMVNGHGQVEDAWALLDTANFTGGRAAGQQLQLAFIRRDWDRADELIRQGTDIGLPLEIFHFTRDKQLAVLHALKGDPETARGHWADYLEYLTRKEESGRLAKGLRNISLAETHAWLGDGGLALEYADLAAAQVPVEMDHIFGVNIHNRRIWVLAKAGQRDTALQLISAKLDQPEGLTRWQLHLHPRWDFFRDDPRFNDLVRPEGVEPEPFQRMGSET